MRMKLLSGCVGATLVLGAGGVVAQEPAPAPDLAALLAQAPQLQVEKVCAPIRSTRGGEALWVSNPDGKSYDVLLRYFDTYYGPHTTVILDLATGEMGVHSRPVGTLIGWGCHIPDGRYLTGISAPKGTGFQIYDPAKNELRDLVAVAENVGGETKPLCIAPDGMIYGAGSHNGRAVCFQLDPKTEQVTAYGEIGPSHAPNDCWGYWVAADTRYIYVASGKIPWYLVAYDRETGKDEVLLTLDAPTGSMPLGVQRGCPLATLNYEGGKPAESYWLVNGKAQLRRDPQEEPPVTYNYPAPPTGPAKPKIIGDVAPLADGTVKLEFQLPEDEEGHPSRAFSFKVPTFPATVYQITALPDGRICGSGGNYLGVFLYDPKTGRSEHPGRLPISMPVMAWSEGGLYLSGYPSSCTMAYDPAQPWGKNNPKHLGHLNSAGSGIHTTLGMVTAADGKVYFCGKWYRNGDGGGLGWWDPKENKGGGLHEGMGGYQTTHITTTGNGRYVVLSSRTVRDQASGAPPAERARIFVYDTVTGKLTHFDPLPGGGQPGAHCGAVAGADGTLVVALAPDPEDTGASDWTRRTALLYAFDAVSGKIAWQKKLPYATGFVVNENFDASVNFDFQRGPDGMIWTFSGGKMTAVDPERDWGLAYEDAYLVRINPATGAIMPVGKVGRVGRMAFLGKDLYLSGGSKYHTSGGEYLRRIRDVVSSKKQ